MDEIIKNKNTYIQYDSNNLKNFTDKLFNVDYIAKEGLIKSEINGRGKTYEIELEGRRFILKNYIRGGLISKISHDKYLYDSMASTRSIKEYNFLYILFKKGLPVPKPAALNSLAFFVSYLKSDLLS